MEQDTTLKSNDSINIPVAEHLGNLKILVHPNPTSGFLNINITGLIASAKVLISLWNLEGKKVLEKQYFQILK